MRPVRPKLAALSACTGCMACVAACKQQAISKTAGADGHMYVRVDEDKCIGCLKCEKVCKEAHYLAGSNDAGASKPYAAWADDGALRAASTSGGFAAAASRWFVSAGGYVAGVSFDGRRARHVLVRDEAVLPQLQGSKYVWSDASAVYAAIESALPEGKVLFIGTGCQVAGVLSYFSGSKFRDNLYTVDLICGGVPSDLLMQAFFDMHPDIERICSFRSKGKYELRAVRNGKECVLPPDSLPLAGFRAEQTMRYCCYDCPFARAHRAGDVTIGDLWGDAAPSGERQAGVSLAVVHSRKGDEILASAGISSRALEWKDFVQDNVRLVTGKTPLTALRRTLARNYRKMDPARFSRVYGLTAGLSDPLGFLARAWVFVLRKINRRNCRRAAGKFLNKCE